MTDSATDDTPAANELTAETLGRLISHECRVPSPLPPRYIVERVIDQLSGIGGSSSMGFCPNRVRSLGDAVERGLAEYHAVSRPISPGDRPPSLDEGEPRSSSDDPALRHHTGDFCLNCGQMNLVNEEGCQKCYGCGYSSC